ncbi:MAG: 50S ribosomal protein L19 [Patescibacteria group bacterium]|nr:50S ribosomal protein L19 [Patescibacteria group bacterium]
MDIKTIQKIKSGHTVRVWEKIKEGEKERISKFQGIVLAVKHGKEIGAAFTVRSVIDGVGVEKIYPIYSPIISKIEFLAAPKKSRRAKIYYIRNLSKKKSREKIGAAA